MKPIVFFSTYKTKSIGRCILFIEAPISVVFRDYVFVAKRRFVLQTFHLDFMFGVLF